MSAPKRLLIEYEDGSTRAVEYAALDKPLREALSRLGLAPSPSGIAASKHYAVLRWEDGWQEVVAVDRDTADLIRYFVIRRIEDRGRLSFEVGGEWPVLFIIERMPDELASVLVVGTDGSQLYALDGALERFEGTFAAGGKREYVKFDGTSPRSPQHQGQGSEVLAAMIDSVRTEVDRMGTTLQAIRGTDDSGRVRAYRDVAAGLGLMGHERQEDVYGLIEMLMEMAAKIDEWTLS